MSLVAWILKESLQRSARRAWTAEGGVWAAASSWSQQCLFSTRQPSSSSSGNSTSAATLGGPPAAAPSLDPKEIAAFRAECRFRRRPDGRAQLLASDNSAWDIKLDMNVPGAVLLKQEDVGPSTPQPVFYMVADQLQQIDLSSDQVVGNLFRSGQWEEVKAPLMVPKDGKYEQIHLMPREFHGLVGIMEQSAKLAEEAGAGREAAAAAAAVAADKKDGPRPR